MQPTVSAQSFGVLQKFQDFYVQIIELKRVARAQPMLAGPPDAIEVLPEGGFTEEIWRKAATILDRQSLDALHLGAIAASLNREARFVMAALADEVFVHPRWAGTDYWLSHLLETRFFHTHSAGDVFFTKATSLLQDNDPAADELAVVYLTALALGFRGKYFGDPEGDAVIQELRVRLYELIKFRNPRLLNDTGHLFPEACLSTIDQGIARRLPDPIRWVLIALGVVVAFYLISYIVWQNVSSDVRKELPPAKTEAPAGKQ